MSEYQRIQKLNKLVCFQEQLEEALKVTQEEVGEAKQLSYIYKRK